MTRRPSFTEIAKVVAAFGLAAVVVLAVVGDGIRQVLVGAAGWKEWMVDDRLSVVFLAAVGAVATGVHLLLREWRALGVDPHRRRRWNMVTFGFMVVAPMLMVNARSVGRLLVFDHPRKDLGWKKELIDVAGWLSDHRPLVLVMIAAVAIAVGARQTHPADVR